MRMQIIIEKFLSSEQSHQYEYKLNSCDREFLTRISGYMNNKNHGFASYESLMRKTGIGSKSTLNKSIRKLEYLGILLVTRKHRRNNEYSFTVEFIHICIDIVQEEHPKLSTFAYTSNKKDNNITINTSKLSTFAYSMCTPITKRKIYKSYAAHKEYKPVENLGYFHSSEVAKNGIRTCFDILEKINE